MKLALAALSLAAATLAVPAHAGLINVRSVLLTNALGQSLQVAEFQAFEHGTGTNVALASQGGVASTTTGTWDGSSTPGKAIDGNLAQNFPNMYHPAGNFSGNLRIRFASDVELDSFTIFGRSDCCSSRDLYNVSFFDVNDNLLFTAQAADARNNLHRVSVALPDTAVPEPTSIALLGLGLIGACVARRRKAA